ncbi:MAG: PIN domain-containing protein [Bryobacteraceae bacterium]
MAVLIETNVLLRSLQPYHHHPNISVARRALDFLHETGETMVVAVQNVIEFWAVATRPQKENGLGLSAELALSEIARFKSLFNVLPETDGILPEWERLVSAYRVLGKNAHDARLVAAMNVNGINKILTFDAGDFVRFTDIEVLHPDSVR